MFVTQGPVDPESPLFVGRTAELKKLETWLVQVNCVGAVLGGRQTGKTSLLLKLRHGFRGKYAFAFVDLQAIEGANVDECFSHIAEEMVVQLAETGIGVNLSFPKNSKAFLTFLQQFANEAKAVRIVVILDEIGSLPRETAIKLSHTIRAVFTNRLVKKEYQRYFFLLAGAVDMLHLTTGNNSPLKNVTESIYLGDLSLTETEQLLAEIFGETPVISSPEISRHIYAWTGGHPYWIQLLASTVADHSHTPTEETISRIIERLLQVEDKNLPHIFRALGKEQATFWNIIESLVKGVPVPFSRSDLSVAELELIGVIKNMDGRCTIRNQLYRAAIQTQLIKQGQWSAIHPEAEKMSAIRNAYALIIGVGDYLHPRFANLPATVRDAQAVAAVLVDPNRCGYSNVQIIAAEKATAANIRTALQELAKKATAESTVLIYFSGHGGRSYENGRWNSYICPREADPDALSRTAISGMEFSDLIAAIPARQMLTMLDACHAGGSADPKAAQDPQAWKAGLPESYYEALSQGSGRVVIASSKTDQVSYVRDELSLFTHYLLEALNGKAAVRSDGLIHVLDVFHYVNEAVQKENSEQVPILKVKDLDLNFPIALDRGGQKKDASIVAATPIAQIRERIIRNPLGGAAELSRYLAAHPKMSAKQAEADTKRAELERLNHDLELFGPNENDKATKNRVVYFLLRLCSELEEEGRN